VDIDETAFVRFRIPFIGKRGKRSSLCHVLCWLLLQP
jgi:hypothetical protein